MNPDRQLAALADPTRRRIFEILRRADHSVGQVATRIPVSRPAVSQHLRVLADAGLVHASAQGTRRIYSVSPDGLDVLRRWVEATWDDVLGSFVEAAREERETMRKTDRAIPPVVKERTVALPPATAFELFTERMTDWWPVATHSIAGDRVAAIRFEGRVGGRVVEVADDGAEWAWGEVLAWDPPHRFLMSWHPNPAPQASSLLEVRFAPVEGGTTIVLEHRGWEEFGEPGGLMRQDYDAGWDVVLEPFVESAVRNGNG